MGAGRAHADDPPIDVNRVPFEQAELLRNLSPCIIHPDYPSGRHGHCRKLLTEVWTTVAKLSRDLELCPCTGKREANILRVFHRKVYSRSQGVEALAGAL